MVSLIFSVRTVYTENEYIIFLIEKCPFEGDSGSFGSEISIIPPFLKRSLCFGDTLGAESCVDKIDPTCVCVLNI